ncbi:MAG: NAD(P)/FAD-dependent oxidoreductase [Nanoarchaeota archaeon]
MQYTIIGGGVVGLAVANELSKTEGNEVVLLERNKSIKQNENQSTRNSGVVHAGIYYPQSKVPNKAKLCVEGNEMLYQFADEHRVPNKRCGKLVVATNDREIRYIDDVFSVGRDNGVPGLEMIGPEKIREYEPNVTGVQAIYVPTSGIIDSVKLLQALNASATRSDRPSQAIISTGAEVKNIGYENGKFYITTQAETFDSDVVINAAGLYSDDIARMINPDFAHRVSATRGESVYFLKSTREDLSCNGMNVYPAPYGIDLKTGDKAEIPFEEFLTGYNSGALSKTVGMHLTPTFDHNGEISDIVTITPAFVGNVGKDDYSRSREERYFVDGVKGFFPSVGYEDVQAHETGIQARLKGHQDFVIESDKRYDRFINLVGIDSPGLTSSLAIAKYVVCGLLSPAMKGK